MPSRSPRRAHVLWHGCRARAEPARWRVPAIVTHLLVAAACALLAGCTLVKLQDESAAFYSSTVLVGRIDTPSGYRGPLFVAAYRGQPGRGEIEHQTYLHEPGGYELIVPKGEYALFAFGDANGNGTFDDGEPAGVFRGARPVVASGSGVVSALDFVVVPDPPARTLPARGSVFAPEAAQPHSTQVGAIADLDAPPFAAAMGGRGYWAPVEFFRALGGNIYFLEPYDPNRIPVLFVHGAAGSPQDWRAFFAGLDRTRYQAWFFYYPSGAAIDSMAYLLHWKLLNLQFRYHFETLYLTAHSMGGLVVRAFLLNHGDPLREAKVFVSLSTPWGGEATADLGVRHSPAVVPSWRDMQPEGRFMQHLFARHLPSHVDHYLLFGHRGGYSLLRPTTDGTVTLASQLRSPAQSEAKLVYGFDEDHTSILASPLVLKQYHAILAAADRRDADSPAGRLHVTFFFDGHDDGAKGQPGLVLRPLGEQAPAPTAAIVIPLTSDDAGRVVGPIPAGTYEASLILDSFTAEPRRQRVRIETGRTPTLSFRLTPRGALRGYVGADVEPFGNAAGGWRPPHRTVRITSIELAGAALRRTLVPRAGDVDWGLERYLDDQDDAYGAFFSFLDLPAGRYALTIRAEGYRPHTSWHVVTPGRQAPFVPIGLTPR